MKKYISIAASLCALTFMVFVFLEASRPKEDQLGIWIKQLDGSFNSCREAQIHILDMGTNVVPSLIDAIGTTTNRNIKDYLYYLVSYLSPDIYASTILAATLTNRDDICVIFTEAEQSSLSTLKKEELQKLHGRVTHLLANVKTKEEQECIARYLRNVDSAISSHPNGE